MAPATARVRRGPGCIAGPRDGKQVKLKLCGRLLLVGHLRTIRCAAALALARVLAFTTVVARLTATLALAGVLAFTSVFVFRLGLVLGLVLRMEGRLGPGEKVGCLDCCATAGEQPRQRCACRS